jgi:hypothetical protein
VNNELVRIQTEAVVISFKELSPHLPGRTEENSRSQGLDVNPRPPEYETKLLTTHSPNIRYHAFQVGFLRYM